MQVLLFQLLIQFSLRRDFTKVSSALSINVGTALTQEWMDASLLSAAAAKKNGLPWVLDPVGVGVTKHRTDHCVELMKLNPTVVRGNASEIIALVCSSPALLACLKSPKNTCERRACWPFVL
jgi:hydroxyethylthiazole kinase-like sugar kinase family protein